jgi:hypothetical protein
LTGAVVRNAALTLIIVTALLFSAIVGTQFVKIGISSTFEEDLIDPTISIISPQNDTTYIDHVPLVFNTSRGGFVPGSPYSDHHLSGYFPFYSLDGRANVPISENTTLANFAEFAYKHRVVMYLQYYIEREPRFVSSAPIYFTVIKSPTIYIIAPENKSYNATDITLNFTVDKSTSWIAYNLDNQTNTTLSGNTTLLGLSNGQHHITVYANDTSGIMATPATIYFNIEMGEPFPVALVVAASVIIAVVGIGSIVYFKKRKEKH